jgi:hypothetical protein
MLVGAVGIENNDERNFKDLRGTRRNVKSLKRNDEASKGIPIAPSKLPRFPSVVDILKVDFSTLYLQLTSASGQRIAARMASRLSVGTTAISFGSAPDVPARLGHTTLDSNSCLHCLMLLNSWQKQSLRAEALPGLRGL